MMRNKNFSKRLARANYTILVLLFGVKILLAQGPGQRPPLPPIAIKGDTSHNLNRHFTPATSQKVPPMGQGFIHRWWVLTPIKKDIARNNVFTDNYLKTAFEADNFSNDFNFWPKNNLTTKIGNQDLKWYSLDSKTINFNLFNFSYDINKPKYGLLFWLVTIIDSPEEVKDIRMMAGCNSGGKFWLNGQEALLLSGDRDIIVDNVASQRLTLKKGRNIIRGAVINGPGMANFCLRFVNDNGQAINNIKISKD